jgi:hypothetical protein
MPRRRTQSRAVLLGVIVVLALVGVMVGVSVLASQGSVEVQLGDEEAGPYDARRLAAEIDDRGPFLLPDASPNRSRDLYVQHRGTSATRGWAAFAARAPGEDDRACTLQWTGSDFADPCSGTHYPADGAGLRRYRTRVEKGKVFVVLRARSAT